MFSFRCCGTGSKTIHDVSNHTFNLSHEESSTFCLDNERNLTISTKIRCKGKAKIYWFEQYDLHNDNGKGSVQITDKFRKTLEAIGKTPEPDFEFKLSSKQYCVSLKCFSNKIYTWILLKPCIIKSNRLRY